MLLKDHNFVCFVLGMSQFQLLQKRKEEPDQKEVFKQHLLIFLKIFFDISSYQGNLMQGRAQLVLKNMFGDQREDSLTSLEVC